MNNNIEAPSYPYIAHQRKTDGVQQNLAMHLTGVADIAKSCAEKIGLEIQAELIGLLHDLGKYSAEFQALILSTFH